MAIYAAEAKRAMEIAERLIIEKDYTGAIKFTDNAKNLCPELDGVKKLKRTIEIYVAGETLICDEPDWYGILNVEPFVNEETVKSEYKNLAFMLHPDKNKCKSAEGACKLVVQAWTVLSDVDRRAKYDSKRRKVTKANKTRIAPDQRTSATASATAKARGKTKKDSSMDRSMQDLTSYGKFWTQCDYCKVKCQFFRDFLNRDLRCRECCKVYYTRETDPPDHNFVSYKQGQGVQQTQTRPRREFGVSQERHAARDFANPNPRNHQNMGTNDSNMFGPLGGNWSDLRGSNVFNTSSNLANGNTQTPNNIGTRNSQGQRNLNPIEIASMNMDPKNIFKRFEDLNYKK